MSDVLGAEDAELPEGQPARRTRSRNESLLIDRTSIAKRVTNFAQDVETARTRETEARLQRYAKYRMWTEGKDFPWENASDLPLPDMTEKSLRVQDTLFNAVMQQQPVIGTEALHRGDRGKQETVDSLIHHQVFEEMNGEKFISDMADDFVNEPAVTVFVPWVTEMRKTHDYRLFDPIPQGVEPPEYFQTILQQIFGRSLAGAEGVNEGWDWQVVYLENNEQKETLVRFYTTAENMVEMIYPKDVKRFDGPRPMVISYDNVLAPADCSNLDIPGPSNPGGASYVILRDFPTLDEINRLVRSGFYDLATEEDMDRLAAKKGNIARESESEQQKNDLQGTSDAPTVSKEKHHNRYTRLICFDTFDFDGDGVAEDVVFWVIKEADLVVKAASLTELYPANPPRRPLVSGSFLPVSQRRSGISLLELLEGLHDGMKMIADQTIDAGTITNAPFFFYRAHGGMKPETLYLEPGIGIPLADPQRDVNVANLASGLNSGLGLNLMTLIQNMEERVSVVSDFEFGRVPAGSSTAMRTIGGMALLAGQGEARPERILRRFFSLLAEIWHQIHELNQHFLTPGKQILIAGVRRPDENPYQTIEDTAAVQGRFSFKFKANVLNTNKMALRQSLEAMMAASISDIALQLGITNPDNIYRLLMDYAKALGQDGDRYLSPPTLTSTQPQLSAEEAIEMILLGKEPFGVPSEPGGWIEHFEKIIAFTQSDDFAFLEGESQLAAFAQYLQFVQQNAQAQQQAIQQAARDFQGGQNQGQPGAPPTTPPQGQSGPPQVSGGNELLDETLPGAGGGAQQ